MKKLIALALAVLMMFSLCACGASDAQLDEILATVQAIQAQLDAMTAEEAPVEEAPAEEAPAEEAPAEEAPAEEAPVEEAVAAE